MGGGGGGGGGEADPAEKFVSKPKEPVMDKVGN